MPEALRSGDAEDRGAGRYTDWHIYTEHPSDSVAFPGPVRVEGEDAQFAVNLAQAILASPKRSDISRFSVEATGRLFRIQKIHGDAYAARCSGSAPRPLDKLGFHKTYLNLMLDRSLNSGGGLMLVMGPPGSGKTTAAAASCRRVRAPR